jgi:hypothetical protein
MEKGTGTAVVIILATVAIVAIFSIAALLGSGFMTKNSVSATGAAASWQDTSSAASPKVPAKAWQVNGNHYNLNIIGAKNVGEIGDSSGHTLFVPLTGKAKIMMTQNPLGEFLVTDRNGLDGSASFNIAPGKYNIYARGLGKPGGSSKIDAYGEFTDALDGSQIILLGYVNIARTKGTPQTVNINQLFYVDVTLCIEVDAETATCTKSVQYTDYWVFDIEELLGYWWEYDNQGLKLLQVRFYPCTLDATGTAADYCRWGDGTPIDSQKAIIKA